MKFSTAIVLAASASMAAAYTNADIPSCATPCIKEGAPKVGCDVTDATCMCEKQDKLAGVVIGCISESCSAEDAVKASTVSDSVCSDLTSKSSTSSNSTAAITTPASTPTPTPSSTNAAGALQAGGMAAGLTGLMGALMLVL
ncbi:putative mac1 interacting protein 1 protein [Neofusicoccum parvum UCRNP2]|uniref:CFEM domain-containing protein n=3 Tax=Neofusicoccum TaxID=407951 RepID=A0ABR3SWH3_9PEZI|nr:putative mac1 interacting protein 1 protein [Neofusicoccum parvum UCRNP2]GME32214.1 hypothetical protein GTA08_BOTSDO00415 [Neofusicoccum parvum]